ncbi:MAG: hypothetical protein FWF67_01790 [Fibromonadales bacterium]|nr:hypothetical protein [Fibromonadales bacterium]
MEKVNESENIYINEKFKEICKLLSQKDEERSRTNKNREKKYENYVIYAIWNRLKNCDLEPVREKGITCKDGKEYRLGIHRQEPPNDILKPKKQFLPMTTLFSKISEMPLK